MNGQRYADDLEGQNDEALEGLSAKVKLLKDVSEFSPIHSVGFKFSISVPLVLVVFSSSLVVRLPLALGTKCESRQYSSARW